MPTTYDFYRELARTRAAAQGSLIANVVQTGVMLNMAGTLNALDAEMNSIRQASEEGLAVQQQMLDRQMLQDGLEQFIYDIEKFVVEFGSTDCELPASSRYFHLKGILAEIEEHGIEPPIIRGRENKAAFEAAVKNVQLLLGQLQTLPEVKEAIAWAAQEQLRLEAHQKAAKLQRERDEQARVIQIRETAAKIQSLKSTRQHLKFGAWYKEKFHWVLEKNNPVIAQIFLWYMPGFGFMWIFPYFILDAIQADKSMNAEVDAEIQVWAAKLATLQQSANATSPNGEEVPLGD